MGDIETLRWRGRRGSAKDSDGGLPHDFVAERVLVGSVMICGGDGYEDLARIVKPEHFASTGWGRIWSVLAEMRNLNIPCDAPTVFERLNTSVDGLPPGVSPMELFNSVTEAVVPQLTAGYARKIVDLAIRRRAIVSAQGLIEMARVSTVNLPDLAKSWDAAGEDLRQAGATEREWVHMGEVAAEVLEAAREKAEGRRVGTWTTGLPGLDALTGGGFQPGDLVILGGRPAAGKTAMSLSMALKSARRGVGHGIFSLELIRSIAARRLLAQESRVATSVLKSGHYPDGTPLTVTDYRAAGDGLERLASYPIWICDRSGQSLAAIRTGIRRLKALCPTLGIVTVDYLQIMALSAGKADSKHNALSDVAQGLRNLAKDESVALVVLSQLNREVDKRPGGKPQLSDLRDSGAIEAAATHVLFPWREGLAMNPNDPSLANQAKLLLAKQTDGPTGEVFVKWHPEYQEFCNMEVASEARWEAQQDFPRGGDGGPAY